MTEEMEYYAFGGFNVRGCECPVESAFGRPYEKQDDISQSYSILINKFDERVRDEEYGDSPPTSGVISGQVARMIWSDIIEQLHIGSYSDDLLASALYVAEQNEWDVERCDIQPEK